MKKWSVLTLLAVLLGLLSGCGGALIQQPAGAAEFPTPTAHALFGRPGEIQYVDRPQDTPMPDLPAFAGAPETAQPPDSPPRLLASPTPFPSATWLPDTSEQSIAKFVPVYSDQPSKGWSVVSPGKSMTFETRSASVVRSGKYALAVSPQVSHGKIYFAATEANKDVYPRGQVYGVSLWLYSGERGLDPYDLALTMIGSNVYPYWREDDNSVESKTPYEETFLRYLGYQEAIPPDTWAEVTIWLDEMRFDPDYTYVTGLYLTNRKGFTRTFYIDDVTLMLAPDAVITHEAAGPSEASAANESTPAVEESTPAAGTATPADDKP